MSGMPTKGTVPSEARVDGLALHRQHAEDRLVDAVEGLAGDEALEGLDAEGELAGRQAALAGEVAGAQALELGRVGVLRAVDQPQVLAPAALDPRLDQAAL